MRRPTRSLADWYSDRRLWILSAILLLAASLRLFHLHDYPPGFFCDEADIANNADLLWRTGRDTWHSLFPVYFHSLGDYRGPVSIYSAIPFVFALGKTEVAVRLMGATYGLLGVFAIFLLATELFDEATGFWAALLLALTPWHIHLSRIGWESAPALFWMTFALYGFARGLRELRWFAIGCFALMLAPLTYYTPYVYTPPLIALLIAARWREARQRWFGRREFWEIVAGATAVFLALIGPSLWRGELQGRWHQVHQALSWKEIAQGYFNHFSRSFLFIDGDTGFPGQFLWRHSVNGIGELHAIELPFLLLAPFAWWFWPKKRPALYTVAAMLAVYPLGTVMTAQNPFATRSAFGVIGLTLTAAIGIRLAQTLNRQSWLPRLVPVAVGLGLALGMVKLEQRTRDYPLYASGFYGWQDEGRRGFAYMLTKQNLYNSVEITHQLNAAYALKQFYLPSDQCRNCRVFANPPAIQLRQTQLFLAREDDIDEMRVKHPEFVFFEQERIYNRGGDPEIFVGTFSELPPLRVD